MMLVAATVLCGCRLRNPARHVGMSDAQFRALREQVKYEDVNDAAAATHVNMTPTPITFADADPVATAKVLADTNKENDRLVIKGGIMSGQVLLPEQVSRLSEIEPREELLSKIAGAFKAPTQKAAGLFGSFTRNAATMFSQLLEKKESGEFVGAGAPAAPAADEPAAAAEEE